MPNWIAVHVSGYGNAFNAFLLYLCRMRGPSSVNRSEPATAWCTLHMGTGRHAGIYDLAT